MSLADTMDIACRRFLNSTLGPRWGSRKLWPEGTDRVDFARFKTDGPYMRSYWSITFTNNRKPITVSVVIPTSAMNTEDNQILRVVSQALEDGLFELHRLAQEDPFVSWVREVRSAEGSEN